MITVTGEEPGAPPCKRHRKDDEPHNKSIRNYFSPVHKSVDKVVTSPRSNNIADYFIKSPPIIEECTPSHQSPEHPTNNGHLPSTPSSKGRLSKPVRRTRLLRRLEEDGSCSPPEVSGHTGFLGSDTAALLAEICSKAEDLDEENDEPKPNVRERSLRRKPVTSSDGAAGDESQRAANEANNTTTITFEEFIKSQAEGDPQNPDVPHEPGQQASPKTVTIQAQVHLSPPPLASSSPGRAPTKMASIFCKKKPAGGGECSVATTPKSDHVIPKRKSNVVIEEEDLELAVIDVETMEATKPKSTAAERQQFMKAFRQAGDPQKHTAKRPTGKKKDVTTTEGADEHSSQEHGEEPTQEEAPAEDKPEERPKLKRAAKKTTEVTPSTTEPLPQPHEATESPQLRRSLRRHRATTTSTSPEDTAHPPLMSTPKTRTPSRKSDHYKAEVLTASSSVESPIRMRFTRISRRINGRQGVPLSDDEAFTPGRKKLSRSTKKLNKAKQILEKAKAIQQNIGKMDAPQRRSARQQHRLSQEHSGTTTPISQPKEEKVTNLRSLNDVLGKREKSKGSGQKKDVRKKTLKSAVITIDDGSEVSENSQDDEHFKAKREFLMSGLPDSLKRHIAKEAALREAYTLSSLSFHSVLHVQQRDGCDKWSLAMPVCPRLTQLLPESMNVSDVSSVTLSIGDFTSCSAALSLHKIPDLMTRRAAFSEAIKSCLLEEIRWSNPQFPVRTFFTQFLKKQTDYLALQDAPKPGGQQEDQNQATEEATNGAKRKRKDSPGLKSKRRKGTPGKDEPDGESAGKARKGRLSRGSLKRNVPATDPDIVIIEDEVTAKPEDEEGPAMEDVLWTEKYQPQSSTELIGNSAAIRKLHSWLRDWKTRAEKEEKRSQMQKPGKDKNDTWDLEDFNDEDSDEDSLCNTMLITGPPGVGKTAAVYACAQELGFKVFEVNASCQRSGRQILAQLKEATQSHQVDQQGVNAHKPCFFSSYNLGKSPRKVHSPKAVVSSPRKPPMSPRGGKKGLAPKSLANFFKAAPKPKTEERKAAADHGKVTPTISDGKACANKGVKPLPFFSEKGAEETQRKSATSLILFEEVDVIFDEDSGFLSAIKTFMSTTKRPVILTTSDEMFGMMFDGVFEEITFRTPSMVNVASYLQVLCLAENLRMDTKDLMTFLTANMCDIRQSVLQLQFWARSGGGRLIAKALRPPVGSSSAEDNAAKICNNASEIDNELPECNLGCAENMMGLSNMLPAEGLIPFVKGKISRPDWLDRITPLLSEFQSRNQDFIYSNLEYLLPLPLCVEGPRASSSSSCAQDVAEAAANEDEEMKISAQMKRRKKLVLLNDSDLFDSSSCSLDEHPLDKMAVEPADGGPSKSHNAPVRRKLAPAEMASSSLVYTCLDSLASLADDLSYVDCSTCVAAAQGGTCNWTESRLRHGLCDSLRIETGGERIALSADEIRAYIEGLSLHKCSSHLTKALDGSLGRCQQSGHDPTQELTLHVSKSRDEVYFSQPFTTTSAAESRLSTARSIFSNRAFMTLGNRRANVTEYLPALRSICRIEKAKEEGKTKRRFLHYLEGIHLELPKTTLSSLAADFP